MNGCRPSDGGDVVDEIGWTNPSFSMRSHVRRFFKALRAKMTAADRHFVEEYLTERERLLFYRQRVADQRHGVDAARFLLAKTEAVVWPDQTPLVKAALLHDVGKSRVSLPLWGRPAAVLLKAFAPGLYRDSSVRGEAADAPRLCQYVYLHRFHPRIGAEMLAAAGTEPEVVDLVRRHHSPSPADPKSLTLLRKADKLGG